MEKIFLIDSGHGGFINGAYQTAPAKMFTHKDGTIAYEGALNRQIKNYVLRLLVQYKLKFIDVCPTDLDIPLSVRTNIINSYCSHYGKENCLLIDLHSNAGGGRGFEIWTSPGQDGSDPYATRFYDMFAAKFPTTAMRADKCDQDPDKESKFWMLVQSKCPAILPEWLFFDTYEDWVIMRDPINQMNYAQMIADFCNQVKL